MSREPVLFYSTNRAVPRTDLRGALLQGQAADRGLFMPATLPTLGAADLAALAGRPYAEVAWAVLRRFTAGVLDEDRLRALCQDAYDFEVPLEEVQPRRWLLRLDRGPTASFKDFAARMMARWMGAFMEGGPGDLVILTATSGDTGSAVAHAYLGVPRVHSVVLFPRAEVSARQRQQMTTLGGNVTTFGVDGKFDDCQAMVKRAFADPDLADIRKSSANSINIGRLLPQAVYYVYAYVRLADVAAREPLVVSVPSGNFGDLMGAVLAQRMGLPLARVVIATNANDEVPRFFATGRYEKIVPSRVCISNAMNVGHPSNLARLVDAYGGWMDETGRVLQMPDLVRLRRDFYAVSISDEETRATIRDAWERHRTLLEPHGAVGWAGLHRYLAEPDAAASAPAVSVETAHPAKFPEEIQSLLGVEPELPPSLAGLEARPEEYGRLTTEYAPFRDLLLKRFAPA
ncbi:MAG TPA: threonine synthase [Candidatus Saccharimonadales bacterium]|nr:threonine synthase [Candidatus Saccharimonadales bacterium]